jgi:molybdopterin/thiamine biosynthesis adenylyltransferase/nitroreductase
MIELRSGEARSTQTHRSVASAAFDYDTAFSRNIGWVTEAEQARLRGKRVAIAGLGGVGGLHLLALARLGVGAFNLAEFDAFDLANFNRQIGATMSTLGRPKLDVLVEMARDINPTLDIRTLDAGINASNIDDFLDAADIYVDGLDFFAFEARRVTFAACARLGVPATTAAPLGMGVALLNFMPGRMTFEEYFGIEGHSHYEQGIRFLLGLSPAMLQRRYLVDRSRVDFFAGRGPSTAMACQLCAGVAATEALKILLGRGEVLAAPRGVHFDAYRNRMATTWRPLGHRNPLQRVALSIARRDLGRGLLAALATDRAPARTRPVEAILDLARWAPSGDNTQPWRFQVVSDDHVVVHGFDTRDHCVYDLDGRASQLAIGGMLETMRVAATAHALRATVDRRAHAPEASPVFEVRFVPDPSVRPSPLIPGIRTRAVQRRAMSTRPLAAEDTTELETSVGEGFSVVWVGGWQNRWRAAQLMWHNAGLRLTLPEAYEVHRSIIEWDARFSEDKVPDQAIGTDPVGTWLMRWVMKSWPRVQFFNNWLGGTLLPRVQLDLIPSLACASHFAIVASAPLATIDDYVCAGGAMQRLWLTAESLGLRVQPEMTPLIFARYVRERRSFTQSAHLLRHAEHVSSLLRALVGGTLDTRLAFMGRIGRGKPAKARSLRRPLEQLLVARGRSESA